MMTESEYHPNLYVVRHDRWERYTTTPLTHQDRKQIVVARELLATDNTGVDPEHTRILCAREPRAVEAAGLIARDHYRFDSASIVPWLRAGRYTIGEVDVLAELAARRSQDHGQGVRSLVLVMLEMDIDKLIEALGGDHPTKSNYYQLGACFKLATEEGESHRQLEPVPVAA
jgi:hypothetical protein